MGQYYKPIILGKRNGIVETFTSWDYDNGAKLMEHSYIGNNFVNAVINTIMTKYHGQAKLVWAGDYAEEEPKSETNLYVRAMEKTPNKKANQKDNDSIRYIINVDKGEFVDLWNVPSFGGARIHPLPLLTCEGNGQGGGDYFGCNMKYIGSWARNTIKFVEWHSYLNNASVNGLTQITPNFCMPTDIIDNLVQSLQILREMNANGELSEYSANYLDKKLSAIPNLSKENARRMFYKSK